MTWILFREKGEFNITNSKAIVQETKDVLFILYSIYEMYI